MLIKKVQAVLESKSIIEENAGSMVNYGSSYSMFAVAEKSQSFMEKSIRNVFIFRIGDHTKELNVNHLIYQRYNEGDQGLLQYNGDQLIEFDVQSHEKL